MRIQTRGNSTTVWLCSDIGVIDGTMTMSAPTLEKILQAVNEKYGTSFEGWSQLPTAYEVGDTVPDWDAYEKIEMTIQKLAVRIGESTNYVIGYINASNEYVMYVYDASNFPIVNADGEVIQTGGGWEGFINSLIKPRLEESSYNIDTVITEIIPHMEVGEIVPDWNSYAKL